MNHLTRRDLIAAAAGAPLLPFAFAHAADPAPAAPAAPLPPPGPMGPLLGHVDERLAMIWYRAAEPGRCVLHVTDAATGDATTVVAEASADHDLCVSFRAAGLRPDTLYRYEVRARSGESTADPRCRFRTPPTPDTPQRVTLAMGSCASSTAFFDIWSRIADEGADGLVLMGDTPYIDRTELAINRAKHRQFLSIPTLDALLRSTPLWATWDDHDFGSNDSDGRIKSKDLIRRAFTEYRALASYGDGEHGIYTRFRRGPVECFVVDPRYFSQAEPSPVDPTQPTCLGKTQWAWLLEGLRASTATFKIIATGMIWDDKKNKEKDDWETYRHEREALFDFIGEHRIGGVVLIGGDIHVSRHLKYPLRDRVGYDLHQLISSPMHERIIPSLNVPHPNLVWGEPIPNIFLKLTADNTGDTPTLDAAFIDRHGKRHYQIKLTAADLAPASPARS